jgi:hypothetical protein
LKGTDGLVPAELKATGRDGEVPKPCVDENCADGDGEGDTDGEGETDGDAPKAALGAPNDVGEGEGPPNPIAAPEEAEKAELLPDPNAGDDVPNIVGAEVPKVLLFGIAPNAGAEAPKLDDGAPNDIAGAADAGVGEAEPNANMPDDCDPAEAAEDDAVALPKEKMLGVVVADPTEAPNAGADEAAGEAAVKEKMGAPAPNVAGVDVDAVDTGTGVTGEASMASSDCMLLLPLDPVNEKGWDANVGVEATGVDGAVEAPNAKREDAAEEAGAKADAGAGVAVEAPNENTGAAEVEAEAGVEELLEPKEKAGADDAAAVVKEEVATGVLPNENTEDVAGVEGAVADVAKEKAAGAGSAEVEAAGVEAPNENTGADDGVDAEALAPNEEVGLEAVEAVEAANPNTGALEKEVAAVELDDEGVVVAPKLNKAPVEADELLGTDAGVVEEPKPNAGVVAVVVVVVAEVVAGVDSAGAAVIEPNEKAGLDGSVGLLPSVTLGVVDTVKVSEGLDANALPVEAGVVEENPNKGAEVVFVSTFSSFFSSVSLSSFFSFFSVENALNVVEPNVGAVEDAAGGVDPKANGEVEDNPKVGAAEVEEPREANAVVPERLGVAENVNAGFISGCLSVDTCFSASLLVSLLVKFLSLVSESAASVNGAEGEIVVSVAGLLPNENPLVVGPSENPRLVDDCPDALKENTGGFDLDSLTLVSASSPLSLLRSAESSP